jgi:nuclear protein localization family protein 4
LYKDKSKKELICSSKSKTLGELMLKHGDTLYLTPEEGMHLLPSSEDNNDEVMQDVSVDLPRSSNSSSRSLSSATLTDIPPLELKKVPEDDVDVALSTQDGMIPRKKDRLCQHGENSGCIHCAPLPPYDEGYLKEHKIKHLSFNSHLRKLTSGVDK